MENLLLIVLFLMAVFLILLVLVQRGRGGGLAGALGGPGGSSAFGAKAGDTFTKITIYAASIWILTCVAAAYWAKNRSDALGAANPDTNRPASAPADADLSGLPPATGAGGGATGTPAPSESEPESSEGAAEPGAESSGGDPTDAPAD